jgi:hypothetical protein
MPLGFWWAMPLWQSMQVPLSRWAGATHAKAGQALQEPNRCWTLESSQPDI